MIVTVANQKGGVGKTTTVITLAHGLALQGYRTLVVDLDPQGDLAYALGLEPQPGLKRLISDGEPLARLVQPARENLDILPGDRMTDKAKRHLISMNLRDYVLADALHAADYALVLLDCAPSLDVLHVNALIASDWLLVPAQCEQLANRGVHKTLETLVAVRRVSHCQVFGILPTFYERVTSETHLQLGQLVDTFGKLILPPIPKDVRLKECPSYGKTIWEYAPTTRAVVGIDSIGGYAYLVSQVQALLEKEEQ